MGKELKNGSIIGTNNSDIGNVVVYGKMENDDQFGLTTLVPNCELKAGDPINIIVDSNDVIPIPNTDMILDNLPNGIWGNACNGCRHNPYIPRDPKQCAVAKRL